jgi:uncharacterized protein (DUF2237 family)
VSTDTPHQRHRERAGASAAVGGAPAEEALAALVDQFSERAAFVRELIQNSLDAGSGLVEVSLRPWQGGVEIEVRDDGVGMDRGVIEGELLTLFRSSKERDATRIGKFGVGFVSVFALAPSVVVVDTGRDGLTWRVIFDERRRYTLLSRDEPFEGTAVTLRVAAPEDAAGALAGEIRGAVHRWCRYARAEIVTRGEGPWGWEEEVVSHPFTVDSPVVVTEEGPGWRAAVGLSADAEPMVGFYNRGLTLLEAAEALLPGVTFRVECDALGHTISRDNVRRDARFEQVLSRLRQLAEGPLVARWREALEAAVAGPPSARCEALIALAASPAVAPPAELPFLRSADGGLLALGALDLEGPLLFSGPGSPVTAALVEAGAPVLLGVPSSRPELAVVAALRARGWRAPGAPRLPAAIAGAGPPGEPLHVTAAFIRPALCAPDALLEAANALDIEPIAGARFAGAGAALVGALACRQPVPGALERADATREGGLVVDMGHPLYRRLAALPVDLGAPLLVQAARRAADGGEDPAPAAVVEALARVAGVTP